MCGIIGVATKKLAIESIMTGLKKLEYRGYDSSGVAIIEGNMITRIREVGKLEVLSSTIKNKMLFGGCGIGHTRWATHGKPNKENAHPHCDKDENIAVVHNGIIENYIELVEDLNKSGIELTSETDSEVIPNMLSLELKNQVISVDNVVQAIANIVKKIRGTYALCIVVRGFNCVFCVKKSSPLVIAKSKLGMYVASDSIALNKVDCIAYLEDGDICVLDSQNIKVWDANLKIKDIEYKNINSENDLTEKGKYRHFMQKEIDECNIALFNTLYNLKNQCDIKDLQINGDIHITACGTALNAGKVLWYLLPKYVGVNAIINCASEYRYNLPDIKSNSLGVVISQSGETADTIGCLQTMKQKGMNVIGITNVITSQIARTVDINLPTIAKKELAVASTKAYVAQLGVMYYLCDRIAKSKGKTTEIDLCEIEDIAQKNDLDYYSIWEEIIEDLVNVNDIYILGRGLDYIVAEEVALKIKEVSYIHCEAMPMGELKHGSLALITDKSKVVVMLTQQELVDKVESGINEIMARDGKVILVTNKKVNINVWKKVEIPNVKDVYAPIVSIRPMQQLAYLLAVKRGNDPDKPRNLAKSVTVE